MKTYMLACALLVLTGCSDSKGEILAKAMKQAMEGCDNGSTAKIEVVAKTWNSGILFTCEWVVSEDNKTLTE